LIHFYKRNSRGMSSLRTSRLNRELAMVRKSEYVEEVTLVNNDIGAWQIMLKEFLPEYLGALRLEVTFPSLYPFKPPVVKVPSIFHPNIYANGVLCISTLHEGKQLPGSKSTLENTWRPSLCLSNVLIGVIFLLQHPNPDSPANVDASNMFKMDTKSYEEKNESLRKVREERHHREKVMKKQEEEYELALALDKVKDLDKAAMPVESGGAVGSSQTEEAEKSIEVKQHIQTCVGRRLFSFRYDGGGEPSVGDLRNALKRQRPDIEIELRAKKINKVEVLEDDDEKLEVFRKSVILVDED